MWHTLYKKIKNAGKFMLCLLFYDPDCSKRVRNVVDRAKRALYFLWNYVVKCKKLAGKPSFSSTHTLHRGDVSLTPYSLPVLSLSHFASVGFLMML